MSQRSRRNRRKFPNGGPPVQVPETGKLPRKRRSRAHRPRPASSTTRRRNLDRTEQEQLAAYLAAMPEPLLAALYKALGGQPNRVDSRQRMVELAVRALSHGNRLENALRALDRREREALAILVQAGGLAHALEFRHELILSHGGHDSEWRKALQRLGEKGLVFASEQRDGDNFFYLVPEPLVPHYLKQLSDVLDLPVVPGDSDQVQVVERQPFCPPLDFSITTLATYMDQRPPRMTQRQEIYKTHQDEMDEFFSELWKPGSELFHFHVDFLTLHGMVELRGDRISVNRDVLEEWLNLDPEDQRELVFAALEERFPHAEWVLWAIHEAAKGDDWITEKPLQNMYRRWRRGEDWRRRFREGIFKPVREADRENYSFLPLVQTGMLEVGAWGQEKLYRLSERARHLLSPPEDDGFTGFYLTPNFEIMAPAGLAPILLFRIGELAELVSCDRANTYRLTQASVERALSRGWRREDVFDFLREHSQAGLPPNVEQTLSGWMGPHSNAEFHQATLLTVHRSEIRRLESSREIKPYLLHRFAPGLYAVDPDRLEELRELLRKLEFYPADELRRYPASPEAVEARRRLQERVERARRASADPVSLAQANDVRPELLHPVPGSNLRDRARGGGRPPRTTPEKAESIVNRAVTEGRLLELVYVLRNDRRASLKLDPERIAVNREGAKVLVARDVEKDERLSYRLDRIERVRLLSRSSR